MPARQQITRARLKEFFTGLKTLYTGALAKVDESVDELVMQVPSGTAGEKYQWANDLPSLRRWIGDRIIRRLSGHSYELVNEDWELTIAVPRNNLLDGTTAMWGIEAQSMGDEVARLNPREVMNLLKFGTAGLCYDGQPFFDTEHPVVINPETGEVASVSNLNDSGSGEFWYLVDASRPYKPFIVQNREDFDMVSLMDETDDNVFMRKEYLWGVDGRRAFGYTLWQLAYAVRGPLTAATYEAAKQAMMKLKNDFGEPLGIKPTHIVAGTSNHAAARELFGRGRVDGGDDNIYLNDVKVVETNRLA